MTLVETRTLIWPWTGAGHLGSNARQLVDGALRDGQLAGSAMTSWELVMLRGGGRLDFPEDVAAWRRGILGQGIMEMAVDGEIGIRANVRAKLRRHYHSRRWDDGISVQECGDGQRGAGDEKTYDRDH